MAKTVLSDLDFGGVARITNLPDPTLAAHPATKGYVDTAVEGLAWKNSVRVATTANINLAAPGATIDGVTMATNDRFLAKDQTTNSQNGVYIWNGAATPATRAADASTGPELLNAVVPVREGTSNGNTTWRQTQVVTTIDSSAVIFASFGTSAGAASESTAGIAEIATQTETNTGTDDTRFITPLKLANWSGRIRKFNQTIGDGSATSINVDHNFGSRSVIVQVFRNNGNFDEVFCDITRPTINRVTLVFAAAPASSALEVVILG